jgi:translocator protein
LAHRKKPANLAFMKRVLTFVLCLLLAYLPAFSGYIARPDAWYQTLAKPPLHPPDWIFAPVWMLLYLLIGIAHGLYATKPVEPGRSKARGHMLQVLQLTLNAAWSPLFFGAHAPLAAGIEILILLAAIALTIQAFAKISRSAAILLWPYLAWACFASYLNWGIVALNR